ncbi:C-type lectin domain family 9 member A-like [Hypanus sabinus]|uniref:C-type lectin domain family 9 member A-like n=1 Tax=Hypanus sabinus TaxID=79690 RepID=UPI0028C3B984|nr:C-type lectin domain family 9 member A-like [Hypanus sabinus]
MNNDLRHQFTEMETKYRSVNETKAEICELLTSRREQTCSEDWIRKKDRCYYITTFTTAFPRAVQECSNRGSRLLEINSRDEANGVSNAIGNLYGSYWIGKCEAGESASSLMLKHDSGMPNCGNCDSPGWGIRCNRRHRFICEKSTHFRTDIPEKIQDLCQQSVGPN